MRAQANNEKSNSNSLCQHVGRRLRDRRKTLRISQAQIAAQLGLSHQQVQKYESGNSQIALARLLQFAQVLNVAPDYFYQGFDIHSLGAAVDSDVIAPVRRMPPRVLLLSATPSDDAIERTFRRADVSRSADLRDGLRNGPPDLVVVEARTARQALEPLSDLKKTSLTAHLPVIVVSHLPSRALMTQCYRAGAAGFIVHGGDTATRNAQLAAAAAYWCDAVSLP